LYWDDDPPLCNRAVRPFRHRIIYYVAADTVRIIAYAHESREPGYWAHRVDSG
jgi:hypothetical protein